MPKKAKEPRKRAPKEERPIIAENPQAALKRLLTTTKDEFDAAHGDGMEALSRGDYDAFGEAIKREREIITAWGDLSKPKKS